MYLVPNLCEGQIIHVRNAGIEVMRNRIIIQVRSCFDGVVFSGRISAQDYRKIESGQGTFFEGF